MPHLTALAAAAATALVLLAPAAATGKPRARAANDVPADKIMHTTFDVESDEHTLRYESWHGEDLSIGRATERLMAGSILSHRRDQRVITEPGTLIHEEASDGTTCDTYNGQDTIIRRRCGDGNVVMSLAMYERHARFQVEHADRYGDRLTIRRTTHDGVATYTLTNRYERDGEVQFTSRTVVTRRDYALLSHRSSASRRGGSATVLRVVERELLPRTEENERLLRMNHPNAEVRRAD